MTPTGSKSNVVVFLSLLTHIFIIKFLCVSFYEQTKENLATVEPRFIPYYVYWLVVFPTYILCKGKDIMKY